MEGEERQGSLCHPQSEVLGGEDYEMGVHHRRCGILLSERLMQMTEPKSVHGFTVLFHLLTT